MILANKKFQSTKIIPLGSTAFRQPYADSHCKFLHGYRLQAKFWFSCNELDNNNWVVDFGSLKGLKSKLEEKFDHTTCIWSKDPELSIFQILHEKRIIDLRVFDEGVGIEMFAKYCFDIANEYVKTSTNNRCWCDKVEVWEHESNSATYENNNNTPFTTNNVVFADAVATTETKTITPEATPPQTITTNNPPKNDVPPLYGTKVHNTFKDPFAGTMWGNTPRR